MITNARFVGCVVLAAIVLTHAAAARSAPPPQKLAHFAHMPKIVTLPDGTLVSCVILHRGPGLQDTPPKQDLLLQHSSDGGKTWSDLQTVATLPADQGGFGFGVSMADREGEIHVFLLCDGNTGVIRARTQDGVPPIEPLPRQKMDIWHLRSTDSRSKWTEPKLIWHGRAGDLQSAIQLKSGRIVLPICGYAHRSWRERGEGAAAFTYLGSFDTTAIYSDDGGATWVRSNSILRAPTPNLAALGAIEPVVVQLNDGRVWMLARTQMGRFYESFSEDGAEWSPLQPSDIYSSDSPAGLLRLDEKRILMMWNNCLRHPYALGGRHVLHAAVTEDDGKSWTGYREILRDPHRDSPPPPGGDHGVSYPYLALRSDGQVVYSLWVQTGEGRSVFATDPGWLTETTQHDDFADGSLEAWSSFGSGGVETVAADGAEGGKAMRIAAISSDRPAVAVRNFPMGSSGELTMRIRREPDAGPLQIVLTDHFSPPLDQEDALHGVFDVTVGEESQALAVPTDRWSKLLLQWDAAGEICRVSLDGNPAAELKARRVARGVCYLRLSAEQQQLAKPTGYVIDTVDVSVRP